MWFPRSSHFRDSLFESADGPTNFVKVKRGNSQCIEYCTPVLLGEHGLGCFPLPHPRCAASVLDRHRVAGPDLAPGFWAWKSTAGMRLAFRRCAASGPIQAMLPYQAPPVCIYAYLGNLHLKFSRFPRRPWEITKIHGFDRKSMKTHGFS